MATDGYANADSEVRIASTSITSIKVTARRNDTPPGETSRTGRPTSQVG
jgi:hypothetical protein